MLQRFWCQSAVFSILSSSIISLFIGIPVKVSAKPAEVFIPHLERIQQTLPPNYTMRLPSAILLGGPANEDFIDTLKVRVFASDLTPGLVVGLYTCEDLSQFCLVGTFSVSSVRSEIAQRQYTKHRSAVMPITLAPRIRGYLLDGQLLRPRSEFSSVMWQQDGRFYSIRFAYPERQNILFMAKLMANGDPVVSSNPEFKEPPMAGNR